MMRRRFAFISTGLWIGTMMGCQIIAGLDDHQLVNDSSDGSSDASTSGETSAPGFTIATLPSLAVLPGGMGSEPVTITRTGGFSDAVTFVITGLSTGITADPLEIAEGQTTGSLTFHVGLANSQSESQLSISAIAASATATAMMNFFVRGPAGSSDSTYGMLGGEASSASLIPTDGALDPNDNLVIAGVNGTPPGNFASIRFTANGQSDDTFGVVSQSFTQQAFAFRAFPLATGSIVYAGFLNSGAEYLRVSDAGAFDTTFSPDGGTGTFDSNPVNVFGADTTGRIYAAGPSMAQGKTQLFIERRDTSGAADSTFSSGTHPVGSAESTVTDAIVQPDGKIITVSDATSTMSSAIFGFALNRFNPTGAFDGSFGVDGYVDPANAATLARLALAPDGSIYVLATAEAGGGAGLFHFSSTGVLDQHFGPAGGEVNVNASALTVQADGKILLLGTAAVTESNDAGSYPVLRVERMTPNGADDISFGTNGFAQANIPGGTDFKSEDGDGEFPVAIHVQSDGRIVAVGHAVFTGLINGVVVVRFWN